MDKEEALEMDLQILKQLKKDDDLSCLKEEFEKMRAEMKREKLLSLKTLPISDIESSESEDKKEINFTEPKETKSNGITPVAIASNKQQPQPEISSTKKSVCVEEPKSSSGSHQDLR